jgi:uncharacterized protein (DUF433 family)
MNELTRIEINPSVLAGKPIIKGTRIPVEPVIKLVAQRRTDDQIIAEYSGLKKEDIRKALLYAEKLVQNEEVYPILRK